jgi:hypothetical protein
LIEIEIEWSGATRSALLALFICGCGLWLVPLVPSPVASRGGGDCGGTTSRWVVGWLVSTSHCIKHIIALLDDVSQNFG